MMNYTTTLLSKAFSSVSKAARMQVLLPQSLHEALIGQLLGDAYADKSSSTSNTRISWSFGSNFQVYAEYIATIFADYCNTGVKSVIVRALLGGKTYVNFRLKTVTLALFNVYFEMFYVYDAETGKYRKIVPLDIANMMTGIVLAHLIMCDGNYNSDGNRVRIYTNSFTLEDCERLAASITAMGVHSRVVLDRVNAKGVKQYHIVISGDDVLTLRNLVVPHMHSSMLYRVGINNTPLTV